MAVALGQIILNEGTDEELRIFPVSVVDRVSGKTSFGYDVYDNHNELKERVGYKHGLIEMPDGSTVHGDTILTVNQVTRVNINDYVAQVNEEVN